MKVADFLFRALIRKQNPSADLAYKGEDSSNQGSHKSIKYLELYIMSLFHFKIDYLSLVGQLPGNFGGGAPANIGEHIFIRITPT